MARPKPKYSPIEVKPGTIPKPDSEYFAYRSGQNSRYGGAQFSQNDVANWIDTTMCYFKGGRLKPIEGWTTLISAQNIIYGVARNVYRYRLAAGTEVIIIGTSRSLYHYGTNITPFDGTTNAIANSVNTSIGTKTVTIDATAHGLAVGDKIQLAAATATGGIRAAELNRAQGWVINDVPNANQFRFTAQTTATSTVSSGGGASTTYEKQIILDDSDVDFPIIWSFGVFDEDKLIFTPGNGGKVYEYAGAVTTPPSVVSNSPSNSNWIEVANNAIISLYDNVVTISGVGDRTNWTQGPASTSFEDDLEDYGRLLCARRVRGDDVLIYSRSKVALMQYTGNADDLYDINNLMESDGICGPLAVGVIDGAAMWMGINDFYQYDASSVAPIEGIQCKESIIKQAKQFSGEQYASRTFAMVVPSLKQVRWWWGPYDATNTSLMGDYVIYDYEEGHATTGVLARTGAENVVFSGAGNESTNMMVGHAYASSAFVNTSSFLFTHLTSVADSTYQYIPDDDAILVAQTPWVMLGNGDSEMEITDLMPDFAVLGASSNPANITWKVLTKDWPQSTTEREESNSVTKTTEQITGVSARGRLRSHRFEADLTDNNNNTWVMGRCMERVQEVTP